MTAEHVSTNHHTPADPEALRADIAQVRAELSATVGELAERVDVKARTQVAVRQARADLANRAHTVAGQARQRAGLIAAGAAVVGVVTAAGLVVRSRVRRGRGWRR
jgi:Protein of unknown function (DUF3618)